MEQIGETARLLVRRLSLADVPALSAILGDPDVMKYSVRGAYDEPATRRFVEWCLANYEAHGIGPWGLVDKSSSSLIGFCGVAPERVGDTDEINLGYRLARRYWGRGLATEAARTVLAYAFGNKAFESVVAIIVPEHIGSLRVAEKVGFSRFREIEFHGQQVRLYRLTHHEWCHV